MWDGDCDVVLFLAYLKRWNIEDDNEEPYWCAGYSSNI